MLCHVMSARASQEEARRCKRFSAHLASNAKALAGNDKTEPKASRIIAATKRDSREAAEDAGIPAIFDRSNPLIAEEMTTKHGIARCRVSVFMRTLAVATARHPKGVRDD
jgi:16S rRNA C1402 (ribose-2'-O) methylase RsmI